MAKSMIKWTSRILFALLMLLMLLILESQEDLLKL